MDDVNAFISDNYVIIIIVGTIIVMTIIGYLAKKLGFGQKISAGNNKPQDSNIENTQENIEVLNENSTSDLATEPFSTLDALAPNFNDGGLVIGDVNQNPAITNQELGISDDLYAPFGDSTEPKKDLDIEGLKIEEVSEDDGFTIIEKDNKKDENDVTSTIEDLSVPLEVENTDSQIENIKIEDVETVETKEEQPQSAENSNPVEEVISDLVDNTFVINDATEDFEEKENESEEERVVEPSKIEQFDIGENDLSNDEPTDFEVETTTTLKLDEINEKIKSLKLEDLDNSNFEDDMLADIKPKRKKKNVSIKSVDEIKKDSTKKSKNQTDETDIVTDLPLPNLNEVASDEKKVDETDDIWSF